MKTRMNLTPVAITVGLALCTISASAQSSSATSPSQQLAAKKTEQIQEKVSSVTQDQLAKILAAEQEWAAARENAKNSGTDNATVKSKLLTLRADRDAKIKDILNSDQYTQYQSMEKWEHAGYKQNDNNK